MIFVLPETATALPTLVAAGTSLGAILTALAAWQTARTSRTTVEVSRAQAAAALQQAAAAGEQAGARVEEIRLLRARLHREMATDSRAAIERDYALANKVSDTIWAGAGSADLAARQGLGLSRQSSQDVRDFLAALRELLQSSAPQLAMILGLESKEWAGLQTIGAMLRSIELGGTWFAYEEFYERHQGFLFLLLAVERKVYARLAEHEQFLRAPIEPPSDHRLGPGG